MKFMNKIAMLTMSVLTLSMSEALADSREYKDSGSIQCNQNQQLKNKDTVILYVNGIINSLDDVEESRQKLSELYQCPECDFRKSYNQTDGFIDDATELNAVGDIQWTAIKTASIQALVEIQKSLDQRIGKLKYDYKLKDDDVFDKIDKRYPTSIKKLLAINSLIIQFAKEQQKSAKENGLFFNPNKHGTEFLKGFDEFISDKTVQELVYMHDKMKSWGLAMNKNSIDFAKLKISEKDIKAYQILMNNTIKKNSSLIEKQFFYNYRNYLTHLYYSKTDFYAKDAKAFQAISKSVESLENHITEYVLAGKKVVVVAHSQGNHITELAYSKLQAKNGRNPNFMKAIQVVGVASVSATTPNNAYITWDQDHTVQHGYDVISSAKPLKSNFTDANILEVDNNHNFLKVYLSDNLMGKYRMPTNIQNIAIYPREIKNSSIKQSSLSVIRGLITGARNSAKAITAEITTNSPLTAQLRWQDWNDMDLHITEPDGTKVSFENQMGKSGELDLDDRDGDGPEHYYINQNTTCDMLMNKTWNFFVHQYERGGHPAVVHFMLKAGDNRVMSRSFGRKTWPDEPIHIASIKFNKNFTHENGSKFLGYEMNIRDIGTSN